MQFQFDAIGAAMISARRRPRRGTLSLLVRVYFDLIVGTATSLLLLVATAQTALGWTVLWLAGYWAYYWAGRAGRLRRPWLRLKERVFRRCPLDPGPRWRHAGQACLLLVGITVFLSYLYLRTEYVAAQAGTDRLWLLYVLAGFVVGLRGGLRVVVAVMVSSCAAMLALGVAVAGPTTAVLWDTAEKALALGIFTFVYYILTRYMADDYVRVRLLHQLPDLLAPGRHASDAALLQAFVDRIHRDFHYPHVNAFVLGIDGKLRLTAAACGPCRELVREGYALPDGEGITWQALRSGRAHAANDVFDDPNYVPHRRLPRTRAELAVPIRLGDRFVGAIDIQDHRTNVFFKDDVVDMEIAATHVARALDGVAWVAAQERAARVIAAVAARLLAPQELEDPFAEIARAAHEDLGAELVAVHESAGSGDRLGRGAWAGRNADTAEADAPDDLALRLLAGPEDAFLHPDAASPDHDALMSDPAAGERERAFLAARTLTSRAVVCLPAGADRLGVMRLYFREPRGADPALLQLLDTFALLAGLAIVRARSHREQVRREREEVGDGVVGAVVGGTQDLLAAVASVLQHTPPGSGVREKVLAARELVAALERDVRYMREWFSRPAETDLRAEIERMRQRAAYTHGVAVDVRWTGPDLSLHEAQAGPLTRLVAELLLGAMASARGGRVAVAVDVGEAALGLRVGPPAGQAGVGHSTGRVASFVERAEQLGGVFHAEDAAYTLTIPLDRAPEDRRPAPLQHAMQPTRVVVLSDCNLTTRGILATLAPAADLAVVAATADPLAVVDRALVHEADVVIADLHQPQNCGRLISVLADLAAQAPFARCVVLQQRTDVAATVGAWQAGAAAFYRKDLPAGALPTLADLVRDVAGGGRYFDPLVADAISRAAAGAGVALDAAGQALTAREIDVLDGLVDGLQNKEIAARLNLGKQTIKSHVAAILRKLGVHTREEAAAAGVFLRAGQAATSAPAASADRGDAAPRTAADLRAISPPRLGLSAVER